MIDQHKTLKEKFIKKGFWLYLFSFIIAPIWYIIKIILSQELSVDEIWIIYWVISLMVLLSSFNDLWIAESLNKFIPEYVTKKDYNKVKTIFFYSIFTQAITWAIIFFIFYLWAGFLSTEYFKDTKAESIIQVFAFFFLWTTFFQVISIFFQSVQDTFSQKITELIRMIFVLCFVIYLFLTDTWDIFTYSLTWVRWLYFWIIVAIYIFYKKYYKTYLKDSKIVYDIWLFKQIFKYWIIVFLGSQAWTILSQIDMQMIIYILWNTDAWYYTNYLSMISIPFMIIWPIFAFLFPVFSEMVAKWENEKIWLIKSVFSKNFLSFSISFSILFLVFWLIISNILFWDKFNTSWSILQYSILFLSFNFLLQINFNILAAEWRIKERLKIILITIIFNSILNYILLKTIWVMWAALTTWLWWVLIFVLSELKLRHYNTKMDILYLSKNIAFFSILWVIMHLFIVPLFSNINNRLYEFIFLFIISIIYFWFYFIINYNDFKWFISEVKKQKSKSF